MFGMCAVCCVGLGLDYLRGELIALVEQSPNLFAGSIADNVRYGKLNASLEQIQEACLVMFFCNVVFKSEQPGSLTIHALGC